MKSMRRLVLAGLVLAWASVSAHAAPKPFQLDSQNAEALRIERQITRDVDAGDRTAADWINDGIAAQGKSDWRAASSAFASAIAKDPASEQAWRNYAIALLRITPEDSERYELPPRAQAAAYKAYLLAPDTSAEARALAVLAEASMRSQDWRPALNAYKESLRLNDQPNVRAAYMKAREEHGFRMTDYDVEADTASPRACLEFSEQLARGRIDFAPFISVVGIEKPAVTGSGNKICIDGLRHGETYDVSVRAGVPSAVDEDSLKPANLTIYVRDRSPAVRFTGRNYVLPRVGQQGIPVVSVNLDRVAVEIFRVGDRGLGPKVTDGNFQRQLSGEEIQKLKDDSGARVFEGQIDVERKLNEEVTTAFPIDETVKPLESGVYVMLARDPDGDADYWDTQATQWFVVSDLGLTALSAGDGVHAFVRSLSSAAPIAGVELKLVARDNEVLATTKTDSAGYARFEAGLTKGEGGQAPAVVTASADDDYGFLVLTQAGFDLSDRGVEGRAAPGPLDALVYTERGVYRPGETVHVTTLLRDDSGLGVVDLPLTLVFERPDGAEERREVVTDQGAGGRVFDLMLLDTVTTGTWRVKAYAETNRPPVGEASFLVEDYVPERLDFELNAAAKEITEDGVKIGADGRWLYGAPAGDLAIEGNITIRPSSAEIAGLTGYKFGLADEVLAPVRTELSGLSRTDTKGHADLEIARPKLPDTSKPLEAEISLRLREPAGRAIERSLILPVRPSGPRIGVKPIFGDHLGDGETANFDVRLVTPDGTFIEGKNLRWELSRLQTRYQWYSSGSDWNYETITTASREADGHIDVAADSPARIASRLGYGRYRLDVTSADPSGPATSVVFDAGWYSAGNAETPDTLEIALDKSTYEPGEKASLRIDARFAGKATIAVVGNEVIATRTVDVPGGGADVALDVTEAWRPGAYVLAFLHRPLDAAASRMPGRAIGVAHAQISAAPYTLPVSFNVPDNTAPRGTFRVPMKIGNLASGEEAHLVVAAVDVGILNLTGFDAPAPEDDAFGQRKLSAEVRDLYGQLIDGMRGARGRIRTGGDAMGGAAGMGEPPTQQPLALFTGIVPVAADGTAEVAFDLPAFNGTVKLMAIAWSRGKLGHAEQDVVIADPVVVTGTLPRFLALGDSTRLHVDVHNVSGPAGEYTLAVAGEGGALGFSSESRKFPLAAGQRTALDIPMSGANIGRGDIDVTLTVPGGQTYAQTLGIEVAPSYPEIESRNVVQLAPKTGSVTVSADLLKDYVSGTGSLSLSVGPPTSLEPAAFISALETYPYGCSEQLSSRLIAILYAEDFGVKLSDDARARAQQMIGRILTRQSSTGGFGLWSPGGDDLWLDSYVTDVLTRAREKGYQVPERAVSQGLSRLKNVLGYRGDFSDANQASAIAYAQYVLARNGRPIIGDLRYLADSRINEIPSPLARAQIAAGLALAGDQPRAAKAFAAADSALESTGVDQLSRVDYGTRLRDGAGVLALAAETSNVSVIPAVMKRVESARADRLTLSTQENSWLLRASEALKAEAARLSLSVDGSPHSGGFNATYAANELQQAVIVANPGVEPARATITMRGSPREAPGPAEQGLTLQRTYYTLDGVETDPAQVAQNTRLVVTLSVKEIEAQAGRLLVVDHLPAGFEIDNPRLVSSAEVASLPWLISDYAPGHSEFRDDRFIAAFERSEASDNDMVAAYIVRAVAPGVYTHPPATVEDMYRPERFARTGIGRVEVTEAQ